MKTGLVGWLLFQLVEQSRRLGLGRERHCGMSVQAKEVSAQLATNCVKRIAPRRCCVFGRLQLLLVDVVDISTPVRSTQAGRAEREQPSRGPLFCFRSLGKISVCRKNGARDSTVDRKKLIILGYIDFSWSFGALSDRQYHESVLPKLS